jgi:hypothetical protein
MQKIDSNSDFVVKENGGVFLVLGLLFLAMFIYSVIYYVEPQVKFHFEITYLTLVPAIYFIQKAFTKKTVIIRINKKGIFYYNKLITSWTNFVKAHVTQEEKVLAISDNFVLLLEFRNAQGKIITEKIPLTNTQDKSEEEIIAAIRFFSLQKNRI